MTPMLVGFPLLHQGLSLEGAQSVTPVTRAPVMGPAGRVNSRNLFSLSPSLAPSVRCAL